MKTIKKLGICMDHTNAYLIKFSDKEKLSSTITLDFDKQDKDETLQRSESEMHNKQQQRQKSYYKKIATVIRNYNEVLLFGPTEAKIELFNLLRQDHFFDNIKMEVINTDKMSENQQHDLLRNILKKWIVSFNKNNFNFILSGYTKCLKSLFYPSMVISVRAK